MLFLQLSYSDRRDTGRMRLPYLSLIA